MNRLYPWLPWLLASAWLTAGEPAPEGDTVPEASAPPATSEVAADQPQRIGLQPSTPNTAVGAASTNRSASAAGQPPPAPASSSAAPHVAPTNQSVAVPTPSVPEPSTAAAREQQEPPATPSAEADPRSFERFRLLTRRNIFDPTRRRWEPNRAVRTTAPPSPPREEILTLNGAILYGQKAFAMVNSSEPRYRGVFSPGDALGEWRVAAIDSKGILLTNEECRLRLPVGQSLRRRGDQPWELARDVRVPATTSLFGGVKPAADSDATPESAAPSSGAGPDDMTELMRRLMERRRQQLNQ